jgi:hypothetical protein
MNLDDIYTPLNKAKKELERRWKDKELKRKLDEYLGDSIPVTIKDEPKAICTFHVATTNWAFFHFWEEAQKINLKPLVFEYTDDLFVTTNFDKASLAKMVFYHGQDDRGCMITTNKQVIDLCGKNEKKKIKDIETNWGENLVDFHHRAIKTFYEDVEIFDGSDYYHKMGKSPQEYYKFIFALYIRNGILFENYLLTSKEKKFTEEVLLPAFEYVWKKFGVKPLIVPITPQHEAAKKHWWCYPEFIKILIGNKKNS